MNRRNTMEAATSAGLWEEKEGATGRAAAAAACSEGGDGNGSARSML